VQRLRAIRDARAIKSVAAARIAHSTDTPSLGAVAPGRAGGALRTREPPTGCRRSRTW
jgi:hypothetical protein